MQNPKLTLFYGFLTWLLPFSFSFLFYSREGQLSISMDLFKSIMIVFATLVGMIALIFYFKKIDKEYFSNGIMVGLLWFGSNIVLDVLILVPMSKLPLSDYINQIGLRYLMIPIISSSVGYIAQSFQKDKQ